MRNSFSFYKASWLLLWQNSVPVKCLNFYYHFQKTAFLFIFLSVASDFSAKELYFLGHVGFRGWSKQIAHSVQSMNFTCTDTVNIFYYIFCVLNIAKQRELVLVLMLLCMLLETSPVLNRLSCLQLFQGKVEPSSSASVWFTSNQQLSVLQLWCGFTFPWTTGDLVLLFI